MVNKEFLQGYRSFIVFLVSTIILIYFVFRMDFTKPETLIHSQFAFWWWSTIAGMYLGKNIVKHGIDKGVEIKKDVKDS